MRGWARKVNPDRPIRKPAGGADNKIFATQKVTKALICICVHTQLKHSLSIMKLTAASVSFA